MERQVDRGLMPIEVAPQEMTRVFLNLFGNGFYAATKRQKEGGEAGFKRTLRVAIRGLGDAGGARGRDNGAGIPPESGDELFQPFFRTRPTGEGTGLGLAVSGDVVPRTHGA